jgi:hypothetical protein
VNNEAVRKFVATMRRECGIPASEGPLFEWLVAACAETGLPNNGDLEGWFEAHIGRQYGSLILVESGPNEYRVLPVQ